MNRNLWMVLILFALMAMPLGAFAQENTAPAGQAAQEQKAQPAQPQSGAGHEHGHAMHGGNAKGTGMMECRQNMMKMHDKMAADLKAMDARLDEKIAKMNAAKGDKKINAMAAVITEMAAQRKTMRNDFESMHTQRMQCMNMMHHGEGGMMGSMCQNCPMMKGQGDHQGHGQGTPQGGATDTGSTGGKESGKAQP